MRTIVRDNIKTQDITVLRLFLWKASQKIRNQKMLIWSN